MTKLLDVGDAVPGFSLPSDTIAQVTTADFVGKPTVLFFYPKDDTSGCTQEAQEFDALAPKFEAAGCKLFGISPDAVKSHAKFKAKYGLGLTLLADEEKKMLEAFGVWQEKSMYGRKYMGVERSTFLVDKAGKIARLWRKVKVPGHAAEVLEAVKALS